MKKIKRHFEAHDLQLILKIPIFSLSLCETNIFKTKYLNSHIF